MYTCTEKEKKADQETFYRQQVNGPVKCWLLNEDCFAVWDTEYSLTQHLVGEFRCHDRYMGQRLWALHHHHLTHNIIRSFYPITSVR